MNQWLRPDRAERPALRVLACALVVGALLAGPRDTRADGDASYGRIDGDLTLVAGAGATLGARAPRVTLEGRLRYLETAGIFATYEEGRALGIDSAPNRAASFGVEVRPLFLARWLQGWELGLPTLDLLVDSFALELGAFDAQSSFDPSNRYGGLQAGLGLELPLFASSSGLFLGAHAGVRWSDAALGGAPVWSPDQRAAFLTVTLSWHQVFQGRVVDARGATDEL